MNQTDKNPRVYSKEAISFSAFFFGPLASGYFLSQNFKRLENTRSANATLWVAFTFTILFFPFIVFWPTNIFGELPEFFIPLVFAGCFAFFYDRFQKTRIQKLLNDGWEKESGWKVAGFGFMFAVLSVGYALTFTLMPDLRTLEFNVGVYCEHKNDEAEALKWFQRSADRGYPAAFNSIGRAYFSGNGVLVDYGKAFGWYEKACALGDVEATYNLGVLYTMGYGVTRDYFKARELFEKAAEKGYAQAAYNLGVLCESGMGGPPSRGDALKWYQEAANHGVTEAVQSIEKLKLR